MTPEQINEIIKLGYMVFDKGNSVMDISTKEMVLTTDSEGNHITDVEAIQNVLGTVKKVRARNKKGQLVGDDPSTPDVNEAWTTKVVKKVTAKA